MMNKAVFLDRDGVINEVVKRANGSLTSPHKLEEVRYKPRVQEAVARLKNLGYKIIIVTNQPGAYYGDMSLYELIRICDAIQAWVRADETYPAIFPMRANIDGNDNNDYKPANGAFRKLIKKWDINVHKSFMIGDRWKDIVPGYNSFLTTIYVNDKPYTVPYNLEHIKPDYWVKDLWEATDVIEMLNESEL